jgi:hypothetical protein
LIHADRLLSDCQRLVRTLETDLRERLTDHPDLDAPVRAEFERAKEGKRTGQTYNAWRDDYLTQVAVHWVLATVFVRFLEDNDLISEPLLAGPGARLTAAKERQEHFFTQQPAASDREYLLACFREVESLPTMERLFDERHNPLFRLAVSADGARAILELFRKIEPGSGALVHDFEDPSWSTRFLGDLYQDLSEAARKRYALLQTPEFVEEFILDRTLEPAMDEIGYRNVTMIDPACGSGHFVLGAFHRIFERSRKAEPGIEPSKLALRSIQQVAGVDVNPFAVAIARFRLLIAALKASENKRLKGAPTFPLNLVAGDSLLHGPRPGNLRGRSRYLFGEDPLAYVYDTEDAVALRQLLGTHYSVVVGNPPYITPKDPILNEAYRDYFGSCHRKYSLAVPFTERFLDLTTTGQDGKAGWWGMITSNSFMKREFGKNLIEKYIPKWDLLDVIDTSGAYIPGHGTPTVILIGRNRPPVSGTVRAVMGIRGEPSTPQDPEFGLVWTAILDQIFRPGSISDFVSVDDVQRSHFHTHPWSIGGGGASELKERIEESSTCLLKDEIRSIGFMAITGEDEAFEAPPQRWLRESIPSRLLVSGDNIRDWSILSNKSVAFMYSDKELNLIPLPEIGNLSQWFWSLRTNLSKRLMFGKYPEQAGLSWYEYRFFMKSRYSNNPSICFAFVGTHNHFVMNRGCQILKQSAPVISLKDGGEDDYLALLGLLNSSTSCFWMKQTFFNKGSTIDQKGARQRTWPFEDFWEHDGTKLQMLPLINDRPLTLANSLDQLSQEYVSNLHQLGSVVPSEAGLAYANDKARRIELRMIALQEELDWQVYRLYGLLEDPLELDPDQAPEVALGERPFEIVLARKMAAGEIETKWFERHGSTPITEIPDRWPEPYRQMIEKRIKAIEENAWIRLIEQPEYKRRWNREPWEEQEKRALRSWLLDRLEDRRYWPEVEVTSTARLADRLRQDPEFRQVAALYRGRDDFDWTTLVTELALDEAVPFLSPLRYTEAGIRKRADWEEVWRLQRLEDAIDARVKLPAGDPQRLTEDEAKALKAREVGEIPVPPRYASTDFRKSAYWRLRGKLDVPKERFIVYPGLERGADPSPVIGWAGWDHLQQARALGAAFNMLREGEGWGADRLAPILAGLLELLPWLLQWHNELDPAHGERMGDYFAGFLDEAARSLGLTREDLARWAPPETARRGRRARA